MPSSQFTDLFLRTAGYTTATGVPGDIRLLLASLVQLALSFVGIIFFILIIYGGFLWLSAGGNEEQVKKAQQIVKSAVVGMIITLFSLMIVRAVSGLLFRAIVPMDTF